MPALLDVAGLRSHITTSLGDAALQALLDGNQAAIEERYGDLVTPRVDVRLGERNGRFLYLSPRAKSVSLVRELYTDFLANQYVVLDGPTGTWPTVDYTRSDWMLHDDGYVLERLLTGTHPADHWEQRIEVTYLPIDNTSQRVLCLVALCKLDINFAPALQAFRVGLVQRVYDHNFDYDTQREAILAMLAPRLPVFA